ncbi:MAG TPA: hypothetical protein VGA73_01670 [Candidatus Binatia bacterium]
MALIGKESSTEATTAKGKLNFSLWLRMVPYFFLDKSGAGYLMSLPKESRLVWLRENEQA